MTITLFTITLYEFDIAFSDLVIAVLAGYFFWKIRWKGLWARLLFLWVVGSSFFGSVFHFFFPDKVGTMTGLVVWSSVALFIWVSIFGMGYFLLKEWWFLKYKWLLFSYCLMYGIYFISGNYGYSGIMAFYAPLIILLWIHAGSQLFIQKKGMYSLLLIAVIITLLAAVVHIYKIQIDPKYLSYNTVYHIVQAIGILYMYRFFINHEK